ncbi:MAG: metallophosphoesterase [Dehalococcoidia bacterium]
MRVAVLSDIHGNLPALEAVLADVDRNGVDRIVLTGDIAAGPLPGETLDRLVAIGDRAVWVRGNADRAMVEAFDSTPTPDAVPEDVAAGQILSKAQRDLLAGLPLTVTIEVDRLGSVLFCHATPRRDDEVVLVDSPPSRFEAVLAGVAADAVVLGHTHMPFARLVARRWVINPGSVGMPYGHDGAAWALLGPTIELRQTAYAATAAAERLRRSALPNAAAWVEEYVLHRYSDIEALTAFTPRAQETLS